MKIYNSICIKEELDDFVVTEVPCLPAGITNDLSQAKYTVLKLTKRELTSFEAIRLLAGALELNVRQVQCLGLKDEDGITEQLVSVEAILSEPDICRLEKRLEQTEFSIQLELSCYTTLPLVVKRLHGNLFRIRLRHMTNEQAVRLYESLQKDPKLAFLNYYDQQRFGLPGGPYVTHKIGEALVGGDLMKAIRYYAESGNAPLDGINSKDISADVFENINPRKKDFFVSAYTSYLWNESVAEIIQSGGSPVSSLNIHDGNYVVTCRDPKIEAVHYIDGYEVDDGGQVQEYKKGRSSVVLTNVFAEPPLKGADDSSLIINLFLPMGCYATMAIKQLVAVRLATKELV